MKQHSPQREEVLQQHFRDNERRDDRQQSPHPPASHAWLASRSPHTASGQRREATASVIASGHENGERGRETAIGHSDHPGEHAKATAVTGSGNSRDRSRQSDLREAASGQKTATGHTETTRANAMKPLAVQRPPSNRARENSKRDDLRPQRHDCSTEHGKRSDSVSNKTDHESHPTKSGLKTPSRLPKPKIGKPGRNPNWSGTRKTSPPHHLTERAEMRRKRQSRTEKALEDSPAPSPRRACRDEEGKPTGTEQVAGVRRKRATPASPVHE